MPEPTPPLDLAALEARHRSSGGAACWICGCWLPCPTLQLVARVRALEAENARIHDVAEWWRTAARNLDARLQAGVPDA